MIARLGVTAIVLATVAAGCVRSRSVYYNETRTVTHHGAGEANAVQLRQFAPVAGDSGEWVGAWEMARPKGGKDRALRIRTVIDQRHTSEHWVSHEDVRNVPSRDAGGPVTFAVARPAGVLNFQGAFEGKSGSGEVRFTPDRAFVAETAALLGHTLTAQQTFDAFWADLGLEYMRELHAARPAFTFAELMALSQSNVTADFVSQLDTAGYAFGPNELVRLRRSGMSSDYAVGMKAGGYAFGSDELVRARHSGLAPDYAAGWKQAGFDLGLDELIRMRHSGVSPEYAAAYKQAGFDFDLDQILRLKNSGVSGDYAAELKSAGYRLSPDEIMRVRNSGVSPSYIAALHKAGYTFSIDDIIRLRNSGVSDEYACALVVEGRKNLGAQDIIALRNRGLDAETIRRLRQ